MTRDQLIKMTQAELEAEVARCGMGRAIGKTDRTGLIEAVLEAHNGPPNKAKPPKIIGGDG